MDLLQSVLNAQGGQTVRELARTAGVGEQDAAAAIGSLLPALATGLSRNAAQPGGMDALVAALSGGSHARYLDNPSALGSPTTVTDGNNILGHILGSTDVSRQVAAQAAAQTGLGPDVLKKMLPLVAAMAMGALSKQRTNPIGHAGAAPGGGLLGMLTPLIDRNRDGSVADDVAGMLGKFLR